jgi:hypothetical protein
MTYAGLLMGTPSRETNDWIIESALQKAQDRGPSPYLIPPPRRDYLRTPGDMSEVASRLVPEWLPTVRCIGSFNYPLPVRDQDKDISLLTVVWFQNEYALPIRDPALTQILNLDWESLATDIEL